MPQLNELDRNRCEVIMTKRECWDALNSMNNNNCPGNDGLSEEFYIFRKVARSSHSGIESIFCGW